MSPGSKRHRLPGDATHDIFRYVALRPLSAFSTAEIPTGTDTDGPVTRPDLDALGKFVIPLKKVPLDRIPKVALDLLKIARRVVARGLRGESISQQDYTRASAVLTAHWVADSDEAAQFREKKNATWGDLVPRVVITVPAAPKRPEQEPLTEDEVAELNSLLRPTLSVASDDGVLARRVIKALAPAYLSRLRRLGFEPDRDPVSRLSALLNGFTPAIDAPPPNMGILGISVPGNYRFPVIPGTFWPPVGTAPATIGLGRITQVHVGDLLVVKRTLVGYVLQEISHIENIMARELRDRNFRRLRRSEVTTESSVEQTLESEKTHQTTERSELQFEAQQALKSNEKIDVGAEVTAHGGFVDASAHAGYVGEFSKDESKKQAASFAHEVIDKAVEKSRLQTRELRIVKLIDETEEISKQQTDNTRDANHIRGIYRWLEKRLSLVLHNYGWRTVYTLLIPTPAAAFAANRRQIGAVRPPSPPRVVKKHGEWEPAGDDEQGSADTKVEPLRPEHITLHNYLPFATHWRVSGPLAAPKQWDSTWTLSRSETKDVSVDFGIGHGAAKIAFVLEDHVEAFRLSAAAVMTSDDDATTRKFADGKAETRTIEAAVPQRVPHLALTYQTVTANDEAIAEVDDSPGGSPIQTAHINVELVPAREVGVAAIATSPWGFGLSVEATLTCRYRKDAELEWQHKIVEQIHSQYVQELAAYEEAQRNARQPTTPSSGAVERIVRTELQGQVARVFRDNKAVPLEVAAFLDRAFEWEELTYAFVPAWTTGSAVTGESTGNQDFDDFLNAGGARVRVSVKPGYEAAIAAYLGGTRMTVPPEGNVIYDDQLGVVPPVDTEDPVPLGEVNVPTDLILLMNPEEVTDIYKLVLENNLEQLEQIHFEKIAPPQPPPPTS
ncbi:MAG: hypothetical protein U1E65_21910 [Myxococcota bacterium]